MCVSVLVVCVSLRVLGKETNGGVLRMPGVCYQTMLVWPQGVHHTKNGTQVSSSMSSSSRSNQSDVRETW